MYDSFLSVIIETYTDVLKQQGHEDIVEALDFSPNGDILVTAGVDGKVKLWNPFSGFCFVTFSEHQAPVRGVSFSGRGTVVLSASLDGTVRAYDLSRYRCFRTLSSEDDQKFTSVSGDASGDLVAAGGLDPFSVYIWSIRTGKLLQILTGHQGPVSNLQFGLSKNMLLSASWDKSVRVWDFMSTGSPVETLEHTAEVLSLTVSPIDDRVCTVTLSSQLCFWNFVSG